MKYSGRVLALFTAAALTLSGCSSLLERDYTSISPHNAAPTDETDPSILRADSYQELVNALIYCVSNGLTQGNVRLYINSDDMESELEAACLEVVQEDPLGAYAVDYIKYRITNVVSYTEAAVDITYRRTKAQIDSIVQATGITAIRSELTSAMSQFQRECVLRVSYFDEDEESIRQLAHQAYYASPLTAFGVPELQVTIYPNSGRQRIVEIQLSYPLNNTELERRSTALTQWITELARPLSGLSGSPLLSGSAQVIRAQGVCIPGSGSTAYDLIKQGQADSEGFSLAMAALCRQLRLPCQVVSGQLNGQEHFWNVVQTDGLWRHLDLTAEPSQSLSLHTDQSLSLLGYSWDTEATPQCLPSTEGTSETDT